MKKEKVKKMTKADFEKAMETWAKRFKISTPLRDELIKMVRNRGGIEAFLLGKSIERSGSLYPHKDRYIATLRGSDKIPSAEKIQDQITAFESTLNRLSPDAIELLCIVSGKDDKQGRLLDQMMSLKSDILTACGNAHKYKGADGPNKNVPALRIIDFCILIYQHVTKKKPSSTVGGCFVEFALIVLEYNQINLEAHTISRMIREIKNAPAEGIKSNISWNLPPLS